MATSSIKTLKTLNAEAKLPDTELYRNARNLVTSAPKVLAGARLARDQGNEERAYVLFMKYLELVQRIKILADYKKDPKYYNEMLGGQKPFIEALEQAEVLSNSIKAKIEDHEKEQSKKLRDAEKERSEKEKKLEAKKEEEEKDKAEGKDYLMTPIDLYHLMEKKSEVFLILDIRPAKDYQASHMKHPYSINIPQDQLKGATCKAVEKVLSIEARSQWERRHKADRIILMDWQSEDFKGGTPLDIVKDAMYRWDSTKYQCPRPYLVKGGYELFAMAYPMKVLNPKLGRMPTATNGIQPKPTLDLGRIEYPDNLLDQGFISTPSPNPRVEPTLRDPGNRSESSPNAAIASGAIKIHRSEGGTPPSRPVIPDRGSKPKFQPSSSIRRDSGSHSSDFSESSLSSNGTMNQARFISTDTSSTTVSRDITKNSELNNGFNATPASSSIDTSSVVPPKIDRSSKAKMLLKANVFHEQKMSKVLEAEDDLADESLQLERQQLIMEEQWKSLRLRKEKEAEEEMKQELLRQESELRERLEIIEEEKERKDEENRELRRQLQTLKEQMHSEISSHVDQRVAMAIRDKDEKRKHLNEEVRRKRRERKAAEEEKRVQAEKRRQREYQEQREIQDATQRLKSTTIKVPLKGEESENRGLGSLNRSLSHSSPNIAQMLEEEDRRANIPAPNFDRNRKPSNAHVARARNFQPTWGTGKKGLTGLKNLGNTCYMNSVLQCLSNFTLPSQYFMSKNFQRELNDTSETQGEMAVEFSELVAALWSGQYKSISPVDFKRTVGKYRREFQGSAQQDAHEFLLVLMEWLHNDVNEIRGKVRLPEEDFDKLPEMQAANASWEMEKKADKSFIRETFYGQRKSSLRCLTCGHESAKYESFFELSVQLPPGNGKCSLRQCIESLLKPECVQFKCPKCNREREFHKKLDIVKFPMILTIHLARFYEDGGIWRKKQNMVDFEMTDFSIGTYAQACGGKFNRYRDYQLYGVCNHFGTMEGGHYTGYCYSQVYKQWYKYDDSEVSRMEPSRVKTPAAYMLFYSSKN